MALIIVLLTGRFVAESGFLGGFVTSLLLLPAPAKVRGSLAGFIAGFATPVAVITFSYLVFRFVAGTAAFGLLAMLAALVSIVPNFRYDLKKDHEMRRLRMGMDLAVKEITAPEMLTSTFDVIGQVTGSVASIIWFIARYAGS